MLDAIVAFVTALGCLFGLISVFYFLFLSCAQKTAAR